MKILMVVHNFPPAFTGGTERACEILSLELEERGHQVHVFSGSSERFSAAKTEDEVHRGLTVSRYYRSDLYRSPIDLHDPECEASFEAVLRQFQPDVVHVHHWEHLSTGLVAIAARHQIPAVISLHDYWTTCALFLRLPDHDDFCRKDEGPENCLPCLRERRPIEEGELVHTFEMRQQSLLTEMSTSAAILISGQRQLQNIAQFGIFPRSVFEKVKVMPIGVVPKTFPRDREFEPRSGGLVTVGHWGNLSKVKGVEVLVQAAARAKHARKIKIKLIGELSDGALQARLHQAAGGARLELQGRYEADRLPKLIADVDVGVFPSLCEETHSIVLDEALLFGMPVIVSDRGAMAARVGDRGLVVPAGDIQALSAALDLMVADDERQKFCQASFGDVADSTTYAQSVEEVYQHLKRPAPDAVVPDLGRTRHAFRNRRFVEAGRMALALKEQNDNIAQALKGDLKSLDKLREQDVVLAAQIEKFLQ